jgi:hypothetical protein
MAAEKKSKDFADFRVKSGGHPGMPGVDKKINSRLTAQSLLELMYA